MNIDCTITRRDHPEFEIQEDRVIFLNQRQEKKLRLVGVAIPADLQKDYENKQYIYPDDKLFTHAFVKVYFPNVLKKGGYRFSENGEKVAERISKLSLKRK